MTMKLHLNPLMSVGLLLSLTTSCGDEPEPKGISDNPWVGITDSLFYKENPLWQLHKDSPLKILAIGNSYTNNATTYMSWLIHRLNGDSICIARLTQGGCTLEKHWDNHVGNASGYYFDYSDRGHWATCDINSLDEALALLDWDVITIQQYFWFVRCIQFIPAISEQSAGALPLLKFQCIACLALYMDLYGGGR